MKIFNSKAISLVFGVLAMSLTISYLATAWSEPTTNPPNGNISAPINTGDATQTKSGGLRISGSAGIGTLNPNNQNAAAYFTWYNDGANDWPRIRYGGTGAGASTGFQIQGPGDIAKITILNNGRLGIGTTAPGEALEVSGSIKTSSNQSLPHLVLDSSGSGDSWSDQGAYISIGESGALGSAAMHLTYTGDGYGYSGAGTVTSGIPAGGYWRYNYSVQRIYTPARVGIGTTSPTQKLDVAGYVKGQTGLCIGNECCSSWRECVDLGGGACTPNCDGKNCGSDGCGGSCGTCTSPKVCTNGVCGSPTILCKSTLGSGKKRIFITSGTFAAGNFSTNSNADNVIDADTKCQTAANNAGIGTQLGATYKALVNFNYKLWGWKATERSPMDVLGGGSFYNLGSADGGTNCSASLVAANASDFFSATSGNYISAAIKYDEYGNESGSGVTAFTNFSPNGTGGFSHIDNTYNEGMCYVYYQGGCGGDCGWNVGTHLYGLNNKTDSKWAGNTYSVGSYSDFTYESVSSQCKNQYRGLYCVEQ